MNPTDTEARLTAALSSEARQISDSRPPTFSWQRPAGVRTTRRPRKVLGALAFGLPAAVAAAVVGAVVVGGGSAPSTVHSVAGGATATAPADQPAVAEVAYLQPGGQKHMTSGQYFYRKEIAVVAPAKQLLVTELWQPQKVSDTWTVKLTQETLDGTPIGTPVVRTGPCGEPSGLTPASPAAGPSCDQAGSWARPTAQFLTAQPTNAAALYKDMYAYIRADYQTTAADRKLNFSTANLSFLTVNYIRSIAAQAGGMSEPFSKALQGATALVPGIAVKHNVKNLAGVAGTSYEIDASPSNVAGPLIFDANGNFIGTPTSAVTFGTADTAGGTPSIAG